jgi:hypothetical protein
MVAPGCQFVHTVLECGHVLHVLSRCIGCQHSLSCFYGELVVWFIDFVNGLDNPSALRSEN